MTTSSPIPVIGLVGGPGSGKSTFAAALTAHGGVVIDADAVGHEVLREPETIAAVRRTWGDGVLDADGQVDRRALGRIVFTDAGERRRLEALLHPRMRQRMAQRIAEIGKAAPFAVLDAAVLFEAGWDDLCTHTVFVDAPRSVRLARVAASRGWTEDELARREEAQIPLDSKRKRCTFVVTNCEEGSHLNPQASELLARILHAPFVR